MGAVMPSGRRRKGVIRGPDGDVVDCVFCNIVRQSKYDSGAATASTVTDSLRMSGDADVITGDEKVVVFRSRGRMASQHLLSVPQVHYDTINDMKTAEHLALLKHMKQKGIEALEILGVPTESAEFKFHCPPANSINHLHMHVFIPPYSGFFARLIYSDHSPSCARAEDIINNLEEKLAAQAAS